MSRAETIIEEAKGILATARFGLEDMKGPAERRVPGLRNAVVFGRMVTFALQNLRAERADFDEWYIKKQQEMKENELLVFFSELRTTIEKKATTPCGTHLTGGNIDLGRLMKNPPPGAVRFFIGDADGRSGWDVRTQSGQMEKYYVNIPEEVVKIDLLLTDAPEEGNAVELVTTYLDYMAGLIDEAKQKFT